MAHHTREKANESYFLGMTVPGTLLRNFDEKLKKAVTESGGNWTPLAPIIIQGAGLELQVALVLTGGATVKPSAFVFGDGDYFRLATTATRSIRQTAGDFLPTPETAPFVRVIGAADQGFSLLIRRPGTLVRMPLRLPDATRLTAVELTYSIPFSHTTLPAHLPALRVVRIDRDGVIAPLPTDLSGEGPERWKTLDPVNLAAYQASAAAQAITLSFSSEAIDRASYEYALEWREEYGEGTYPERAEFGTVLLTIKSTVQYSELHPY